MSSPRIGYLQRNDHDKLSSRAYEHSIYLANILPWRSLLGSYSQSFQFPLKVGIFSATGTWCLVR